MAPQLTLRWLGHACFAVTYQDFTVVFDPFEDNYVPGFGCLDVEADLVLCSHNHRDHGAAHVVSLRSGRHNPFQITTLETFHDPEGGALRGKSLIHVLQAGNLRLAHMGDIGCPLTPEQIQALQGLDVALIPIGGFYTIGPAEALTVMTQLKPKVAVPMHYRLGNLGFPIVAELTEFLSLLPAHISYSTDTMTIDENTQPQVAVLKFMGGR